MKVKFLLISTEIAVNEKDESRCSIKCQHILKIKGNYACTLFDNKCVDDGDDDDIGYGFKRVEQCLQNDKPAPDGNDGEG